MDAIVSGIFICPVKGEIMLPVDSAQALTGQGLQGDRYSVGKGTWNDGHRGKRQVTLISSESFLGTNFSPIDSRRNLLTQGIEVNTLMGRYFTVGEVLLKGVKYCDPCGRIDDLSGKKGFKEQFRERGGIIAEVFIGGLIKIDDPIAIHKYGIHSLAPKAAGH